MEGEEIGDIVTAITAKFDERYLPYQHIAQATAVFNSMFQKEGQLMDDFIVTL